MKLINILNMSLLIPWAALPSSAETVEAILAAPARLYLKNGQTISGKPLYYEKGELVMLGLSERGEVEYVFHGEAIERLEFPGDSLVAKADALLTEGKDEAAQNLLMVLYRQRAPFLGILRHSDLDNFEKLAQLAFERGDFYTVAGVAHRLRPYIDEAERARRLGELELRALYHLPLKAETHERTAQWMAGWHPYGPSALGWYLRAQRAYDKGDYEAARAECLQPIVFSSQFPMEYLEQCYALAIASALALQDTAHAARLFAEMQSRGMPWPVSDSLPAPPSLTQAKESNRK